MNTKLLDGLGLAGLILILIAAWSLEARAERHGGLSRTDLPINTLCVRPETGRVRVLNDGRLAFVIQGCDDQEHTWLIDPLHGHTET